MKPSTRNRIYAPLGAVVVAVVVAFATPLGKRLVAEKPEAIGSSSVGSSSHVGEIHGNSGPVTINVGGATSQAPPSPAVPFLATPPESPRPVPRHAHLAGRKKAKAKTENQGPVISINGGDHQSGFNGINNGNITINTERPPRHLGEGGKTSLLGLPKDKLVSVCRMTNDSETSDLALEVRDFLKREGYKVDDAINFLVTTEPIPASDFWWKKEDNDPNTTLVVLPRR